MCPNSEVHHDPGLNPTSTPSDPAFSPASPLQVDSVLRRAARLVRRIGQEPLLMPPDLEAALDEQLAGSDAADASDSEGDDVEGHRDGQVSDGGDDGSDDEGDGFDEEGEDDDVDPAAERWASVMTGFLQAHKKFAVTSHHMQHIHGYTDIPQCPLCSPDALLSRTDSSPLQTQRLPICRSADDDGGAEDADAPAAAARRKRKRLPGEDANLRFDEMEAYLQARMKSSSLIITRRK